MSDRIKYLVMGVVVGTGIIFLLAMTGTMNTDQKKTIPSDQVGTYQLAAGNSFYVVLDTRTGQIVETKGEISQSTAKLADWPIRPSIEITLKNDPDYKPFEVEIAK